MVVRNLVKEIEEIWDEYKGYITLDKTHYEYFCDHCGRKLEDGLSDQIIISKCECGTVYEVHGNKYMETF